MTKADKFIFAAVIAVAGIAVGVFWGIEVSKRKALAARAAAEPWRQSPEWRGTELTGSAPEPVIQAFENDPPAPDGRVQVFAEFLPGQQIYSIGWYGTINSVSPNVDGWEATVKIGCRLKGRGIPFYSASTAETWQISKSGAAQCIKCEGSAGPRLLMTD